jgi:hypothetical protein
MAVGLKHRIALRHARIHHPLKVRNWHGGRRDIPPGISKPEEGGAVAKRKVTVVFAHLEKPSVLPNSIFRPGRFDV